MEDMSLNKRKDIPTKPKNRTIMKATTEDNLFSILAESYQNPNIVETGKTLSRLLPDLNQIVIKSAQDAEYRVKISVETKWEIHLENILNGITENQSNYSSFFNTFKNSPELGDQQEILDFLNLYIRLFRGFIIICRNLITVSETAVNFDAESYKSIHVNTLKCFNLLSSFPYFSSDMKCQLYVSTLEFLSNLTTIGKYEIDNDCFFEPVVQFLSYGLISQKGYVPWCLYLTNLCSKNQDFLYYAFKNDEFNENIILGTLLHSPDVMFDIKSIDTNTMTTLQTLIVKLWYVIICHESFPNFFYALSVNNHEEYMQIVEISTVIVSSKESWDNFELTNVMVWIFKLFDELIEPIDEYFNSSKDFQESHVDLVEKYYETLICVLDMVSSLCKFEHIRKFMHFYKGLDKLIRLLHILEKNCVKLNIIKGPNGDEIIGVKDNKGVDKIDLAKRKIKAVNFPHCKSFIIEIISYLTYDNKEVQDKVRELNGLEIILSNCIIDDNEPFIKERSIVCLRYLLTENKENQDLIAKLEAQKPVQDTVLDEAGFEVEIDDQGKVGLKKRKINQ